MNQKISNTANIAVFYDGNFFSHASNYYVFQHRRQARISIDGLHNFIISEICDREDLDSAKIIDAHYFRGRIQAHEAADRGNKLLQERIFEDVLMRSNVQTHYLPLSTRGDQGEKGIDVLFAVEVLDLAYTKNYDIIVLIAGDGDYTPLVRKLLGLRKKVVVVGWEFSYDDEFGNFRQTKISEKLINECSYCLQLSEMIESRQNKRQQSVIDSLFVQKQIEHQVFEQQRTPQPGCYLGWDSDEQVAERQFGFYRVANLKNGFGFVTTHVDNERLYFYHADCVTPFNDLKEGDLVKYELSQNDRGPCAISVELVHETEYNEALFPPVSNNPLVAP